MAQKNAPNQWNNGSTKGQKKAGKQRARKRKAGQRGKGRVHQKAPDPWQENYERLRLVLGSLIESQGGEIKVSIALCEQYDVTKVLHVNEDDDGNYVLTLEKPLGAEKPDEEKVVDETATEEQAPKINPDMDTTGCNLDAYAYMVYVHEPDGDEYKLFGEFNDALDCAMTYCENEGLEDNPEDCVIPLFKGKHPAVSR